MLKVLHAAATIVVFAALATIALKVLHRSFNFTNAFADVFPSSAHALRDRDLLEDLQDEARSALNAAATRVADAASQAESAISSAAATVQNIEEHVPQNCSLGTKRFCIGYKQDVNCSDLPLNLSSLLPEGVQELPGPVQDALRDRAEALSQLAESSTRFLAFSVPSTLISGLVLMVIARVFGKLKAVPRALALLGLGLVCCSPFVLLGVILDTFRRVADELPSWVGVEIGEACGLGFAALACALVLTFIFAAAPGVAVHVQGEDAKGKE
ncbi:hypothetical protein PTNB73_01358 [Pyrenophora teres f. teres]|uniref:Uncharacterized protein n=1 Tax=Pyrenophora teres f. teres TaxID=97479 RepID=A0A6S6VIF4_9PLEO|nr:hypothetical protein HRS9139_02610 [Pyrenophora teres f. teres]KAE8849631.1 hypothetical protein PTNB85_00047 [Pyrenophora teres f. teres]KAE8852342.1 hypothetical protein HRS9122_02629 [Pyrenophora teres f. teres]KAE8871016.1 hypothetical protein PTNB29_01360 [Pyrenophora teres f. teres]KAE8874726.1 hypothetical protein PTNB73_01358 [Pyrenophora teres f. teres]